MQMEQMFDIVVRDIEEEADDICWYLWTSYGEVKRIKYNTLFKE